MSSIRAVETITGTISAECTLTGKLSPVNESLTGYLSCTSGLQATLSFVAVIEYDVYKGDYTVVPSASTEKTLETSSLLMKQDVVVKKVPYSETSNLSGGLTVYIAEEV